MAFRRVDRARRFALQGKFEPAVRLLVTQRAALNHQHLLPHEREFHIAENFVVHAELELSRDNVTSAVTYYGEALAALEISPENARNLGRILHDAAVTLASAQASSSVVIPLLTRAREVLTRFGQYYRDDIDAYLDFFTLDKVLTEHGGQLRSVEDVLNRVRERLANMSRSLSRCHGQANLASLLVGSADPVHWEEAQRLMYEALRYLRENRDPVTTIEVMSPLRVLASRDLHVNPQLLDEVEYHLAGQQLATSAKHRVILLELTSILAYRSGRDQWNTAMVGCLSAMAIADRLAARTPSTMIRTMTRETGMFARYLAMTMASDLDDPALVLECAESARLQAIPILRASEFGAEQELSTMLSNTGGVVLGPLQMLSLGPAASRLRDFHNATDISVDDFDLADLTTAVGGIDAWLWSAVIIDFRYFWTVLAPDGKLISGYENLSPDFASLFKSVVYSTDGPGSSTDLLFRLYGAVPADEEAASLKLGELLIPYPLLSRLADRGAAVDEQPFSIVVAGNVLAAIPVSLLAWREGSKIVRLLERSVPRWAPPAAIVKKLLKAPLYPAQSHPVLLSCVDPDNTLPYARSVRDPAAVHLRYIHSLNSDASLLAGPATRQGLISELGKMTPSAPGTFFYSGHSTQGAMGIDGGLLLQDGHLSTEQILFGANDFEAPSFPARVILSSCESGGAAGAGRGEWLGLTAVCLLRGARQVAATAWPIFDCAQTQAFEEEILEAIGVEADLAVIIRNAQLRRLKDWCDQKPFEPDSLQLPEISNSPLVWAAFQCIGLAA